jgi:hypothetical protein
MKFCLKCIFCNKCIIISSFQGKKSLPYEKGGDFIDGNSIIFLVFILLGNVLWTINMKPYGHKKECKLYILYTLILSNLFNLIVGSKLILT